MYCVYEIACKLPGVHDRYVGYSSDFNKAKEYMKDSAKPPAYIDTIEVEADNREDAKDIAWDLFDKERAVQGEGEILATEEVTE